MTAPTPPPTTLTLSKGTTAAISTNKNGLTVVTLSSAAAETMIIAQISANGGTLLKTDTLANLCAAVATGGTLILPAGSYSGCANIPNVCTIIGAGADKTTIEAGPSLASGKSILCPMGLSSDITNCTTISGLCLTGATCPSNNGAAIREEGDGIAVVVENCAINGNQMGILTFDSNYLVKATSFDNNGNTDGESHNIYANGLNTTIDLEDVVSIAGARTTHCFKSRKNFNIVNGGTFTALQANADGNVQGSVWDFPQNGNVNATGATLTAGLVDIQYITVGGEISVSEPANPGGTMTIACVFKGVGIVQDEGTPAVTIDLTGSTGTGQTVEGFASVVGVINPGA